MYYLEVVPVQPEGDDHSSTANITSLPHLVTVMEHNSGKAQTWGYYNLPDKSLIPLNCVLYMCSYLQVKGVTTNL